MQKGPILVHLAKCDLRWRKASLESLESSESWKSFESLERIAMAMAIAMAIKSKVGRRQEAVSKSKNVASLLL